MDFSVSLTAQGPLRTPSQPWRTYQGEEEEEEEEDSNLVFYVRSTKKKKKEEEEEEEEEVTLQWFNNIWNFHSPLEFELKVRWELSEKK